MIKIGEFSKLVQVPVRHLALLRSSWSAETVEVDRFTGYRYYSASQLPRLHRILALKGLGFSLEQIGAVLAEGLTPEQMRGMLPPASRTDQPAACRDAKPACRG